jgi:low affinity Fe/Cu permease
MASNPAQGRQVLRPNLKSAGGSSRFPNPARADLPRERVFRKFARGAADAVASPAAFLLGVFTTLIWAATGSYFHYSDTWQLVINTGTSIGTFLIVFLIQNTQNQDSKVMQLKLDELIRSVKTARTELVQMESLTDQELDDLQKELQLHRDHAAENLERILASRQRRQFNPNP